MPEFLQHIAFSVLSCEAMITEFFLLEVLFWHSVFSIFSRAEQEQDLAVVGGVTIVGTLCTGIILRDPAALFLVATPLWACLATMGCFTVSWVSYWV